MTPKVVLCPHSQAHKGTHRPKEAVCHDYFLLVGRMCGSLPFQRLGYKSAMLTAGQGLTLPVSQDECAGILLKSTVRKALLSVAAKLLLTSLLIAVIGSCSPAAAQVRQVLCGDQGAVLDPQL